MIVKIEAEVALKDYYIHFYNRSRCLQDIVLMISSRALRKMLSSKKQKGGKFAEQKWRK